VVKEQETPMEKRWVTVAVEDGQMRASVLKAKLEAFGIPVILRYESVGVVIGITVDGLGKVKILVPESYASQARELLEESFSFPPWEGGEVNEGGEGFEA